ncbi:MAG: hypothetical protein ABIQ15_00730 [Nocardioides sp.]
MSDEAGTPPRDACAEATRRRRLAEVFGDVLPETTSDERDTDAPMREPADEAWLRAQVPPHHGQ